MNEAGDPLVHTSKYIARARVLAVLVEGLFVLIFDTAVPWYFFAHFFFFSSFSFFFFSSKYWNAKTDDNGNAMFQSYLSKLFKKETG